MDKRYRTLLKDRKHGQSTKKTKKRKAWNKGKKASENTGQEQPSTSKQKLINQNYPRSSFQGYRLFDLNILAKILTDVTCCKLCGGDIILEETQIVGLGGDYTVTCQECNFTQNFSNCTMIGEKKKSYELNQRSILASRMIGSGLSGLKIFCGIMDLPPPVSPKTFSRLQTSLLKAATEEADASMKNAVNEELMLNRGDKEQTLHEPPEEGSDEESSDKEDSQDDQENSHVETLTISGDGTWQKRGFKSLNGAVSVIGSETGKILDHEVLTSYCQACAEWQEKNGLPNGEAWDDWYDIHKLVCKRNYSGSAGMMESAGMIRIFQRSEEKHGVHYTKYIGDGDSKTFFNITKAQPYGEEIKIEKLECIAHVGKRFGYHMRKLKNAMKKKKLSDGKGLFGKGRLTEKKISSMQTYYTGAIRNNPGSLSAMIRAIWAIWYHMSSTDELPQHQFCPTGAHSWCKYQRAAAVNDLENFNHNPLPTAVMDAIRPVFIQMTSISLLRRCLGGQTQNSNECFNSILWKICPKNIFVGYETLSLSAKIATILFNDGMCGILRVMQKLNMTPGIHAVSAAKKKDKLRIDKAEKQKAEDVKKKRIIYKKLRINLHEDNIDQEGENYHAGAF